jgi:hypothetical protein
MLRWLSPKDPEPRKDEGVPTCWNPDWLLWQPAPGEVVQIGRRESIFEPMAQPVRWS